MENIKPKIKKIPLLGWLTFAISLSTLAVSTIIALTQHKENKQIEIAQLTPLQYSQYFFSKDPSFKGYRSVKGVIKHSGRNNIGIEGANVSIILDPNLPFLSAITDQNGVYQVEIPVFHDTIKNFSSYTLVAIKNGFEIFAATCPFDVFPNGCDAYLIARK